MRRRCRVLQRIMSVFNSWLLEWSQSLNFCVKLTRDRQAERLINRARKQRAMLLDPILDETMIGFHSAPRMQ
jgi:hypothetical protein